MNYASIFTYLMLRPLCSQLKIYHLVAIKFNANRRRSEVDNHHVGLKDLFHLASLRHFQLNSSDPRLNFRITFGLLFLIFYFLFGHF